jgi:5,10-methylenetetrahydrofolate reductase
VSPKRRLTPTSETLVLFIQDKGLATYEDARDLVEAVAAAEIQAVAEQVLRRIARGEGLHFHGLRREANANDVLTRGAVEKIVRSEAGL